MRLLLLSIRNDDSLKLFLNSCPVSKEDSIKFKNLVLNFSLLVFVYQKLKKENLLAFFPEAIKKSFQNLYLASIARNLRLLSKIEKMYSILETNNIKAVIFKGPASSSLAYNDSALRSYSDLDLMILPNDFEKVVSVLKKNGCEFHEIDSSKIFNYIKKTFRDFNATYKDLPLDIHQQIAKGPSFFRLSGEQWEDRQYFTINKTSCATFSIEHTILFLSIQCAEDGWTPLKTITDLSQIIGNDSKINWEKLISIAKKFKAFYILKIALNFVLDLTAVNLPKEINEMISDCKKTQKLYKKFYLRLFDNQFNLGILNRGTTIPECLDTKIATYRLYYWFLTHPSPGLHPLLFKLPRFLYCFLPVITPFYLIYKYKLLSYYINKRT